MTAGAVGQQQRGVTVADDRPVAVAATVEVAVAWAAEAGQSADADAVLDALCVADRDNRAADQAMIDAAGDIARMTEIIRNQISFIEVYVLRVLARSSWRYQSTTLAPGGHTSRPRRTGTLPVNPAAPRNGKCVMNPFPLLTRRRRLALAGLDVTKARAEADVVVSQRNQC